MTAFNGKDVYRKGYAAAVREFAAIRETFSMSDLYDYFDGISQGPTHRTVVNTLWDMRRRGEIVREGLGQYRLVAERSPQLQPTVRIKIYRAMYSKGIFSAREIRMLSAADMSYAMRVIRRLVAAGDLEPAGKKKNPRGRLEHLFRTGNRDRFYRIYIKEMPDAGRRSKKVAE